jgi:predicted SAM-dependent methyltransferase
LPYWRARLQPGGTFRCVVPDLDAMITQYRNGEIAFDDLRQVAYGGQEYEGDFHHTAFTPESMEALLLDAGFGEIELIERGRVNGACLEFELSARRPA